jgi:hypothetical protein
MQLLNAALSSRSTPVDIAPALLMPWMGPLHSERIVLVRRMHCRPGKSKDPGRAGVLDLGVAGGLASFQLI